MTKFYEKRDDILFDSLTQDIFEGPQNGVLLAPKRFSINQTLFLNFCLTYAACKILHIHISHK